MPSRGELSNGQDWSTVAFSSKPGGSRPTTPRASGPKPGGGGVQTQTGMSARKLEEDTESLKHETVSKDLKKSIQQARQAKNMTQKQLAQALVMDVKIVNEYESGKAIPNNAVIAKMEKALGVKLPRAAKAK